jgi:hypothetical protein
MIPQRTEVKMMRRSVKRRSKAEQLRDWMAMRLQRRRRHKSGVPPLVIPAPVLTLAGVEWNGTAEGWADVVINVGMNTDGLPNGVVEMFVYLDSDLIPLGESAPNDGFCHPKVTRIYGEQYTYVGRFRAGEDLGPMSSELIVEIPPP